MDVINNVINIAQISAEIHFMWFCCTRKKKGSTGKSSAPEGKQWRPQQGMWRRQFAKEATCIKRGAISDVCVTATTAHTFDKAHKALLKANV